MWKFGYSRDKRSDCVQVVIALIVTPDGFPLAYEVMDGNTSDKTTLKEFLAKIEKQYGKAKRTWVMDRGIPTEEVLAEMRNSNTLIHYLVGSPRGTAHATREGVFEETVGGRARERAGQTDRTRGRDVSFRSQRVELPTDNRVVVLSRYTEPDKDLLLLLRQLITPCSADLWRCVPGISVPCRDPTPSVGEVGLTPGEGAAERYCVWRTLIARQSSAISEGLHRATRGEATSRTSGCALNKMIGT
jgi:hypothetical protein